MFRINSVQFRLRFPHLRFWLGDSVLIQGVRNSATKHITVKMWKPMFAVFGREVKIFSLENHNIKHLSWEQNLQLFYYQMGISGMLDLGTICWMFVDDFEKSDLSVCLFSPQVWEMSSAPSLWCTRAKGRPGGFAPDPAERFQPQPRSTANMLIKEYRIPMPMSVEEYRIAQLYMIQVCSWFYLALKSPFSDYHTDLCHTTMFRNTTSVKYCTALVEIIQRLCMTRQYIFNLKWVLYQKYQLLQISNQILWL